MYCSVSDLYKTYGELKVDNFSEGDPQRVEQAIDDAESEINGYLASGGYSVPLINPPEIIKNYAKDIAFYNLLTISGIGEQDWDKTLLDRTKKAYAYLGKIAEGKYIIPQYTQEGEKTQSKSQIKYRSIQKLDLSGR